MFLEYSELLNSLDSGATTKITINNRRLNKADFEQTILIPMADDGLDKYRKEYNKMLLDKATGANSIVQDKYVTVSVCKKNIEEARNYFARVGADLIAHFNRLGSKCVELDAGDKLRIFHDFYRTGEETAFHFDITQTMRKGHDFKDFICPDTVEFESDYFRMGDRYGRVIFLREYAAYIKDSMVAELCELNRNMMLSVDIIPVPTDEAVREVENRLLGVETNITNWQRKQNQNNNFSAVIPYDLEQQRKESKEFLDDLTTRDQRMMFAVLTMVHTADSKEQLDNDTEALLTTARKHLCQLAVLKYQQMDGLNTALPFGVRKIDALRTLTTESLAVFIPFRMQEIYHENGVYYGQNVISKNMIIANRRQLLNGNSFILGVSGAGKSFTAKEEMTNIILTDPNADIIIIDPEREYSPLVKAMQGEVIHISATSENHINAMDMNSDYGDGANPVILKSEFILSLCEQLIGGTNLGAKQKSIIDRCTASVYRYYQQGNYMGTPPTLQDFREELLKQNEPEAQEIALAIELFTDGSLNTFAKHTNVDTHSRLICYDMYNLENNIPVEVRGCTAFAYSSNGRTIYGRNNDLPPYLREGSKSEIYAPKNGNRFNITTSSFINGEEGVNEHGFAVAMTFVMTDLEKIKAGFNSCFIVRYLLEKADNTEQAVSLAYLFLPTRNMPSSQIVLIGITFCTDFGTTNFSLSCLNRFLRVLSIVYLLAAFRFFLFRFLWFWCPAFLLFPYCRQPFFIGFNGWLHRFIIKIIWQEHQLFRHQKF